MVNAKLLLQINCLLEWTKVVPRNFVFSYKRTTNGHRFAFLAAVYGTNLMILVEHLQTVELIKFGCTLVRPNVTLSVIRIPKGSAASGVKIGAAGTWSGSKEFSVRAVCTLRPRVARFPSVVARVLTEFKHGPRMVTKQVGRLDVHKSRRGCRTDFVLSTLLLPAVRPASGRRINMKVHPTTKSTRAWLHLW